MLLWVFISHITLSMYFCVNNIKVKSSSLMFSTRIQAYTKNANMLYKIIKRKGT